MQTYVWQKMQASKAIAFSKEEKRRQNTLAMEKAQAMLEKQRKLQKMRNKGKEGEREEEEVLREPSS
jgi:hypothetical protein